VNALGDPAEWGSSEGEWRRLAEQSGNPFMTPEWSRCWLGHYGEGLAPFVPLARSDGRLAALLPLVLSERGRPRVARIAGANLGDRFHPLSPPGAEREAGEAVGAALAEARSRWSVLALDRVELAGGWLEPLREALGVRVRTLRREGTGQPLIRLAAHEGWEGYLASRSSHLRKRLRWLERRIGRDHEVALRRAEDPARLPADMRTLFDLHDRRWAGRGGSSLASARARAFHLDFAAAALERGWLRLWLMEWDSEPVAAWYGWRVGGRYAFYNGGFDPDRSKLSPGMFLLARVIEAAFDEGASKFDFLLGEESYKTRFADEGEGAEVTDVVLARSLPHPAATLAASKHALRSAGRRMPIGWRRRLGLQRLAVRLRRR
jgi:CelD/BcsL family acetyltransferase involved in cellulose biosynthesis